MKIILLMVVLLLSACAANTQTYWRNVQNTRWGQLEFNKDWYECRRQNTHVTTLVYGGIGLDGPEVNEPMAAACLNARGWYQTSK
jgi:hypothetical protein